MTSIAQIAESLQQILEKEARGLAKESGFIVGERAFSGADFAQALILGWMQRPDERMEGFVQMLERREVSITASGLSQRFTHSGGDLHARDAGAAGAGADGSGGGRCAALAALHGGHRGR